MVSEWCVGDFGPLLEYLKDVRQCDFDKIAPQDIVQLANVGDRFLMKRFVDANWGRPLHMHDHAVESTSADSAASSDVCNFSGKLITADFAVYNRRLKSVASLADLVKQRGNADAIVTLDVSDNDLLDKDMKYVVDALRLLPNCRCVDLSHNHLRMAKDEVMTMLQQKRIETVDITCNPLSWSGETDFFACLQEEDFKKLVWIPGQWVDDGEWRRGVDTRFVGIIRKKHRQYYEMPE